MTYQLNQWIMAVRCPMCKTAVENAQNASQMSDAVNDAVLVLLIPTILIIGALARIIYKHRHTNQE